MIYASRKYAEQAYENLHRKIEGLKVNNAIPRKVKNEQMAELIHQKSLVKSVLDRYKNGEI